jgi:hypothetical protein
MRSLFTAVAFLVILLAVIPAVRRSLYPMQKQREDDNVNRNLSPSQEEE